MIVDDVTRDLYLGPILRELEGLPRTELVTGFMPNGQWRAALVTDRVTSAVTITRRDLEVELPEHGAFVKLLDVKARSLTLRHYAAYMVGAYPGWCV